MSRDVRFIVWMGGSKRELRDMPEGVQDHLGYALHVAQVGGKHADAKPLKGFGGAGVVEIVSDHQSDTYRGVYTVRLKHAVYVLHVFQRKSTREDGDTEDRIGADQTKTAGRGNHRRGRKRMSDPKIEFERGSENVFADLGFPDAEEHVLKARLVRKIAGIVAARGLTQVQTAEVLGVTQPDISNMLRGQFRRISVERLLHHLVALGQDVEIVVKPIEHGTATVPGLRVA